MDNLVRMAVVERLAELVGELLRLLGLDAALVPRQYLGRSRQLTLVGHLAAELTVNTSYLCHSLALKVEHEV
jgi:hypothetical protein